MGDLIYLKRFFDKCKGEHSYLYHDVDMGFKGGGFKLDIIMKCTNCGKKTTLDELENRRMLRGY